MPPYIARYVLTVCFFIIFLSLIVMNWIERGSAEYVVNVIALMISIVMVLVTIYDVRRQVRVLRIKRMQ
ncbi:MAG: hypothetical protein DRN15_10395 [Thermoprotei archaeon]|nr:MAG: hypothetical protein DRN15_10395 [Thermoprotei archaeon]